MMLRQDRGVTKSTPPAASPASSTRTGGRQRFVNAPNSLIKRPVAPRPAGSSPATWPTALWNAQCIARLRQAVHLIHSRRT
eukprot:680618-Pyramimonas_sp.AAC.1